MQIPFNGTDFINARLTQCIFSVWPMAQTVVGETEMHSVANLATLQNPLATFFFLKKSAQTLFSLRVLPREVLLSQHAHTLSFCSASAHTSLSLSTSAQFRFSAHTHIFLSLCIGSVSVQRAHTHLSLSLSLCICSGSVQCAAEKSRA